MKNSRNPSPFSGISRKAADACSSREELSRIHRERLLRNGFLQEVMKGWLISSSPSARDGDSTPWYASFWEFCARYCQDRFGEEWHLSPEQSLLLHAENTVIPTQVVVYSPKAANHNESAAVRHVALRPQAGGDAGGLRRICARTGCGSSRRRRL